MEQSTQTTDGDRRTSTISSHAATLRPSQYENVDWDNLKSASASASPRRLAYKLVPAKTHHSDFRQRANHTTRPTTTTAKTTAAAEAPAKRAGLLGRRPQLADCNAPYSPRRNPTAEKSGTMLDLDLFIGSTPLRQNGEFDTGGGRRLAHGGGGDGGILSGNGGGNSAQRANDRRTRLAAAPAPATAENRQTARRAAAAAAAAKKERIGGLSPLFVRSNTVPYGAHHAQTTPDRRPIKTQAPSSAASSGRGLLQQQTRGVEPADHHHHWPKHPNSAPDKRKAEVMEAGAERDKSGSSPDSDRVNLTYSYYMPIQLVTQGDEDKAAQRDPASLATVSLPKKGRLKLTGLQYELNNPEIYDDNRREATNVKEQQRTYHEELMGPALPHNHLDLYRGALLRNKSILKQVKQGEQLLEQEEEAMRHQKHWRDHDGDLVDLIQQLLHYDMPEVPTINKSLHEFAGIPNSDSQQQQQQQQQQQHQHQQQQSLEGGHPATLNMGSQINTTSNNNNDSNNNNNNNNSNQDNKIISNQKLFQRPANNNDDNIMTQSNGTHNIGLGTHHNHHDQDDQDVTTPRTQADAEAFHSQKHQQQQELYDKRRRLKSRSAQEQRERASEFDHELHLQLPSSPRSLLNFSTTTTTNINSNNQSSHLQAPTLNLTLDGSTSARSARDVGSNSHGGRASRNLKGALHCDWSSSPLLWGRCDSLHGVLAHAQKITLNRANSRKK